MRVMIADDEVLVRISLRSMIEEMEAGWELTGEATNGVELLEQLRSHKPDIVLVDIRMPLMNGLEAIRGSAGLCPHTQFIVISGYSDFAYAQEALKLGTADYLLKPVSPEDLEAAMVKAGQRVKEHTGWLNCQFEADLFSLFHGISPQGGESDGDYLSSACCQGVVWYTDSRLPEERKAEKQHELHRAIRQKMDLCIGERARTRKALFILPEGELAFVVACGAGGQDGQGTVEATRLSRRMEEAADAVRCEGFAVTAFVMEPCTGIAALQKQWGDLRPLAALRSLLGVNRAYTFGNLQAFEQRYRLGPAAQLVEQACRSYRNKDYMLYMKAVGALEKEASTLDSRIQPVHKKQVSEFLSQLLEAALDGQEPMQAWLPKLYARGEQILAEQNGSGDQAGRLVKSAITFIEQNYAQDISILQIAKELRVTHNYLSTLFHKKTGTTFVKYLTRLRMMKAKELLAMPDIQVQQAAEKVGYYSTRHFTRLFTEFTGCYPSEYKKRFGG